ncbi:MAG: transglycosylase domain-containing protein [Aestuariivita sp.]|nr:transglycosylase domain-containing protein [Aestuariivita sp.]
MANILEEWRYLKISIDQLEKRFQITEPPLPTPRMCKLLIVGEDRRFGKHPGVDPIALCRAVRTTYLRGTREGGSTIAMQLVRVLTNRYERTFSRKIREILLAVCVTRYVPKERIPILYLSSAYYGWRMNDFREACARLKLNPMTTDEREDAELVARLKYPQPKEFNSKRMKEINQRGQHLIQLLNKEN